MKRKTGKCIDCPPDAPATYLIAKRCQKHYWIHRKKVNQDKPKKERPDLKTYFANQILQIPTKCEECGADLTYWKKQMPKAIIAHILPKRVTGGFPSVATHPANRMFFCPTPCHADYDNKGNDHALKMKSLPIIRERFDIFKGLLTESELQRIPDFLKQADG